MELPVVQYKRHRLAYTVLTILGLIAACASIFSFAGKGASSITGWILLVIGLTVFLRCGWLARDNSVILELNHEGIRYKEDFYRWNTLRSYAIRKDVSDDFNAMYLILHVNGPEYGREIQLDWINDFESIPAQMAVYAKAFQVTFDGIEKKEL